jgi:uncharacterized protein YcgI (DUF1989 family)
LALPGDVRVTLRREMIAPQSGRAFVVQAGERMRVTDVQGEQVADIVAFALPDVREAISNGRTIDYNGTLRLTAGHVLYSNRGRPMLTVVADTVGRHDFTLAPCSPEMFALLHNNTDPHPSCFENLSACLAPHGIAPDAIPTAFNAFMTVEIDASGGVSVVPPTSKAGDYVELRAEMPLVAGVTACSAEQSNNNAFKPIEVTIFGA